MSTVDLPLVQGGIPSNGESPNRSGIYDATSCGGIDCSERRVCGRRAYCRYDTMDGGKSSEF